MTLFLLGGIFLIGLFVGSFLNCIIYRLYRKESFLLGRSYCPKCKQELAWYDLIPVLSFLILKGKCRQCRQKISWQYPLVEIATGILFVLLLNYELIITNYEFLSFKSILYFLFLILNSCFLIIIFVYDLKHYIIPDKIIFPAIGLTFFYQLFGIWNFGNWDLFGISLPAQAGNLGFGILPSLLFLAIILFSQGRWMGLGDFKLAIFMGFFLGWPDILPALFFAFLIGAIIGLGLIILGKKGFKSEIPFGPFLVIGTFIGLFWGQNLINWYLKFIL